MVVYVDDILVLASTPEDLDQGVSALLDVLRGDGWYVAVDKCFLHAMVVVPFLGILVDLGRDCLRVSEAKASRFASMCRLTSEARVVSLAALQRIGGTLAFFTVATPLARFCRSGINRATMEAESLPGRTVGMKGELKADLEFWAANAGRLPLMVPVRPGAGSTAVVTDAAGAPLRGFGGLVWPGEASTPDIEGLLGTTPAVDSADFRKGIPRLVGDVMVVYGPLSATLGESSASLELEALLVVLVRLWKHRRSWVAGRTVVSVPGPWRVRSVGLAAVAKRLFDFCEMAKCVVDPHWVSRALGWMPAADWLSRQFWRRASAECTIPQSVVSTAITTAGWSPTVDLFATRGNSRCAEFASQWPEEGGRCGGLRQPGVGARAWAFPPFSQVGSLFNWVRRARDTRVLCVVPVGARVPSTIHIVSRACLPPTRLIDSTGHTPEGFSKPLEIMEIRSPS